MSSQDFFKGIAALAVFALPACSGGGSATQVPAAASGVPVQSVANAPAAGRRSPASLRAFAATTPAAAADCSTNANNQSTADAEGSGNCSNVQIGGTAYGPNTPGNLLPGLHPADLQSAYQLPSSTAGTGQTIGIVIVGDDPNLQSDLAVYRSTFGLPTCSSATGCLRVIPTINKADANWSREVSTDVDMASAVCPNCKLLVVEAKSNKDTDLAAAVTLAVAAGVNVVSNSYAIPESTKQATAIWSHPGVPIVAAAGDNGYTTANWPAASPDVIAVGATTLTRDGTTARGWREAAWSGSGSGCSTLAPKPAWQSDSGCAMRTVADVAAVGDPASPVAVYDTYQNAGWVQIGGTSVATPIIAGVYALAANSAKVNAASSLYAHPAALFPVSAGSNGTCSPTYLCTAGGGYSGPTGLGSPHGIAAF